MKALILTDSDYKTTVYDSLYTQVIRILEQKGYSVTEREAGKSLNACIGCFGCWVKTPGECVIQDTMAEINRLYVNSDVVVFLSPVVFGQQSANMKNVFDRLLPRLLPFFIRKADGSTGHPFRYNKDPKQFIIGYGSNLEDADIQLFKNITIKHRPGVAVTVYQGMPDSENITALFSKSCPAQNDEPSQKTIPVQDKKTSLNAQRNDSPAFSENQEKHPETKKVVFINGSPRIHDQTASGSFIARAEKIFDDSKFETEIINVRKVMQHGPEAAFEKIRNADAVVFAFPLYIYCLPGLLIRFLQEYESFLKNSNRKQNAANVYAVVNCGFPEPYINEEAVGVIKSFCRQTGMKFRSSVLIGGGVMITKATKAPPVKKVLKEIDAAFSAAAKDLQATPVLPPEDTQIKIGFPDKLFFFAGGLNWKMQAKHNGLKVKDIYRRPY